MNGHLPTQPSLTPAQLYPRFGFLQPLGADQLTIPPLHQQQTKELENPMRAEMYATAPHLLPQGVASHYSQGSVPVGGQSSEMVMSRQPEASAGPGSTAAPAPVVLVNKAPLPLGRKPQSLVCPYCNVHITTNLKPHATARTHLIALGLCVTSLGFLAFFPYCMKSCRRLEHYCSNCNQYLGHYKA